MRKPDVTVFVCVSCRSGPDLSQRPGQVLFDALHARLSEGPESAAGPTATVEVKAVKCLSVCTRPATIALSAPDKWTYVIGDLSPIDSEAILAGARDFAATPDGIVPWNQRPLCFRKGTVSRTPPFYSP